MPLPQRTRVAAYGLLTDGDRILLCRISEQHARSHGAWTLPGGGIEFGESPEAAMIREVKEETGLIVKSAGLAGIDSIVMDVDDLTYHCIRIIYHAELISGQLRNETDGSTDLCQWWSRNDLPRIVELVKHSLGLAFE